MTTEANSSPKAAGAKSEVVVWDFPVRLFHWALVALVACQWWTAENGYMGLHRQFGLALVGLLVFRIYWGVVGTRTARFASFIRGPRAIGAYLKTLRRPYAPSFGHNPLGALSVVALLGLLCVQVGTGLFAVDVDGIESGQLSHLVSFDQGRQLADIHETSFDILVVFIGLHLVAVTLYYIALGANLIKPMVTGKRKASEKDPADAVGAVKVFPFVRIAIGLVIAGGVIAYIGQ